MKQTSALVLLAILAFTINAYAQTNQEQTPIGDKKMLVVYFSHSGNTRLVAEQIQALTGADLFEIKSVRQYSKDYNKVLNEAQAEQKANARPELATTVPNIAEYNVVFIGYPIWYGTIPMPVFTFLESYDFNNKTIIPFCTHGGSQLGNSITDITKLAPNAEIAESLAIRSSRASNSENELKTCLTKLDMFK